MKRITLKRNPIWCKQCRQSIPTSYEVFVGSHHTGSIIKAKPQTRDHKWDFVPMEHAQCFMESKTIKELVVKLNAKLKHQKGKLHHDYT